MIAAVGAGCAAGVHATRTASPFGGRIERRFDAPKAAVWRAVLTVIEPVAVARADVAQGVIETVWSDEMSPRRQGALTRAPFQRRARYRIQLTEHDGLTWVAVIPTVEERAPGGARALRWERVAPTAEQTNEWFDRLERALADAA